MDTNYSNSLYYYQLITLELLQTKYCCNYITLIIIKLILYCHILNTLIVYINNMKTIKQKLIRSITTDIYQLDDFNAQIDGLLNLALKFVPKKELIKINEYQKKQLNQ